MDIFSTELGIRFSFVKTSEFQEGVEPPPPQTRLGTLLRRPTHAVENTLVHTVQAIAGGT
jgi:hypothetical protein